MKEKLNILVLHKMGDPLFWRKAIKDLEFMMPTFAPDHNYIVHPADLPIPDFIKDIIFHGIILGPTFLCSRYNPEMLEKILKEYDFIRNSSSFKIALPQDDYDCSSILDNWLINWKVDLVYSVCPNGWEKLYPKFSKTGRIKLGYTGYISNKMINFWKNPKALDFRTIDISYRANKLPPNFGRVGNLKGTIGDIFKMKLLGHSLKLNISTDPKDVIPGEKWYKFLENSKFCLVSNSGSSLLDPYGELRKKVNNYLSLNPNANFSEVEKNCFPGEDGKNIFTAISPRNIEAALAETVQIATPGDYSGIMKEGMDYIRLEEDCSNILEIISLIKDREKIQKIRKSCKESVLNINDLRFENHVPNLIQQIENGLNLKSINGTSQNIMEKLINSYKKQIFLRENFFWKQKRLIAKLIRTKMTLKNLIRGP